MAVHNFNDDDAYYDDDDDNHDDPLPLHYHNFVVTDDDDDGDDLVGQKNFHIFSLKVCISKLKGDSMLIRFQC